ncbi:hypothetical protein AWB80_01341 [Caballeronia pedi]|uniref:HTH cro/C1-type domain-containing protein n=1 Tax=Caballeronia pedi TaxID=1777141 RepID=A0A157ZWV9_9BURK|nr:hypothetical protein AWB80_01341 [Caballeronia pedi]
MPGEENGSACLPGGWPEGYPPRSALFDVEPEGVCGASFESLYSVFRRTSAAHLMRPFTLANRSVTPLFGPSKNSASHYAEEWSLSVMNGVGKLTERWLVALSQLTLRNDLYLHTLFPLRHLIPYKGLLCRRERFCPDCFRDDERTKRPKYHRLLWAITCVEACPLHGTLLQEEAKIESRRNYPYWLPGVARTTGRSLSELPSVPAPPVKIRIAKLVADLLDDVHRNPEAFRDSVCAIPSFLWYATDFLFDRIPAHFANHIGVTKSSLHGWMTGKNLPSLPRLSLIAHCCGCTLPDVLLGNKVFLKKIERYDQAPKTPRRASESMTDEEIIQALDDSIERDDDESAFEIARRLGLNHRRVKKLAPDRWAMLVQRRIRRRTHRRVANEDYRFSLFYQSFKDIQDRGVYPSRRLVAEDVFKRTGVALRFTDRFLQRAHVLSGTQLRHREAVCRTTNV